MMKRITAALLAAALFLTLTGCADASERQSRKTALRILRGDDLGYHLSTGTAVENQEVYNDGSIVIQLGGISGTPVDPQLVLHQRLADGLLVGCLRDRRPQHHHRHGEHLLRS